MTQTLLSDLPEGWKVEQVGGPPGFTTRAILERPDGSLVEWTSRRHRKRLGLRRPDGHRLGRLEQRWGGRPNRMSWWMGALFAIGSLCFAVGSLPLYFDNVSARAVGATFFVGSIFFTSAAYLQFLEAQAAPEGLLADPPRGLRWTTFVNVAPRRLDWWAAAIQFVGTIFFNVSTFAATRSDLTLGMQRSLIWAPDVFGSVCFLLASWLAYSEVNRGVLPRGDGSVGWLIAALNLAGSIAFGVAAIAARYKLADGQVANVALVNAGTAIGAVCFFVGAVLLPVESARDASSGSEADPSPA